MRIITAIIMSAVLVGCTSLQSPSKTKPWSRSEIVGHKFELIATDQIEEFAFQPDGSAPATIGTDEAITAPLMSWRLDLRGTLTIQDEEQVYAQLRKVSFDGNTVKVLRNRKPVTYKVTKTN